jgi:hypothetical protein
MAPFEFRFLALTLLLNVGAADGQVHISSIKGEVSVRHGDAGERTAALVNRPVGIDDRIATGPNARVDIEFDSTNTFRIGSNAEIRLMPSASGRYQTELVKGDITYNVQGPSTPSVAVDTPSVSVRPTNEGVYRIALNGAGESEITVRSGEVEVFAPSGSQWIGAGQKMVARGSPSDPEFKIVSAIPKWRRAARIFLASVQIGDISSSSNSDDKSSAKTAPKPASKTTPTTASNGASKTTPPTRGTFSPAPSTHSASTSSSHGGASTSSNHAASASSTHTASASSTQTASNSSAHSASFSSDHSSSSSSASSSHK